MSYVNHARPTAHYRLRVARLDSGLEPVDLYLWNDSTGYNTANSLIFKIFLATGVFEF